MKKIIKIAIAVSVLGSAPSSAFADSANQPDDFMRCAKVMNGKGVGQPWWTDIPCWAAGFFS
jgi:hypothetical protein